ncbi:MAG: tyrosine-type recombinase/integrase [Hyphomonadaceae bacterium]|nr:tyrosine-type recombinase/integrase [Hyphomonadaceae bacterium]
MRTVLGQFVPWNKDKVTGQKPPLKPREVWAIRVRLQISNRVRDLALFNLAIDSKLRGCDLVHLRVEDVIQDDQVRTRALISQRKTGAPVQFEITEQARAALAAWVRGKDLKTSDWLFPSRVDKRKAMTTRQYGRLVDEWIAAIGLSPKAYGTHSLRRTKAALIYRKTGKSGRYNSFSGTPSWTAPSDIWVSRLRTPWQLPKGSTSSR